MTGGSPTSRASRSCGWPTWRRRSPEGVLRIWVRKTPTLGTNPTLRAFLRVFDPATSGYTELGTANVTVTTESTGAWVEFTPTWTLSGVSVPVGRLIEIKSVATGGTRNVEIAYDKTACPSRLNLP